MINTCKLIWGMLLLVSITSTASAHKGKAMTKEHINLSDYATLPGYVVVDINNLEASNNTSIRVKYQN